MNDETKQPKGSQPPRASKPMQPKPSFNEGSGPRTLISRRGFLYGAIGAGALAAIGVGATVSSALPDMGTPDVEHIDVPENALTTLAELEVLDDAESVVRLVNRFELPYGTLVWANDDDVAACLLPTETGSPLAQVGLLSLGSGTLVTILKEAVSSSERFEIYDVRATSRGVLWTEANVLKGAWRIYAAPLEQGALGKAVMLEEGDDRYDTPTLAVVDSSAFWQVLPKLPNDEGLTSRLMRATFGKSDASCVFESTRRMGTPPYATRDSVTISPRVDTSSVYYQLTNIDAKSGKVTDQMTLPRSMTPLEAGYGTNGFMFSFPDIYDYGGGISNLGTYTPMAKPQDGNYSAAKWFGFARTPTAAPAWSGNLFIVKSSYSVCGVDLAAGTYFAIDVDDGADTYGEYLATTGVRDTFVTYANIDHTPVNGDPKHVCRVKVWAPLTQDQRDERAARAAQGEDGDDGEDGEYVDYEDYGVDDLGDAGGEMVADEAVQA